MWTIDQEYFDAARNINFKIRCSSIGYIMTDPKGKQPAEVYADAMSKLSKDVDRWDNMKNKTGPGYQKLTESIEAQRKNLVELEKKKDDVLLSDTAKTYCKNWLKSALYERRKEVSSKHTEKGHIMEDTSIDFVAEYMDYGMLIKNEVEKEDDFKRGTPDVITKDAIIDVKSSWDCFTFPLFEKEIPNMNYYWQIMGYMDLFERDQGFVAYVLTDTPVHLIEREAFFYARNNGMDMDDELLEEFTAKMTYPDVDDHLKIKWFEVERDQDAIDRIHKRVEECRQYIFELLTRNQ